MAEMHQLSAHCRVCGGRLERSRRRNPKYSCLSYQEALETTFGLVVKLDSPAIHPAYFCNSCCAATRKKKAAVSKGVLYRHSITLFNWTEHIIADCTVSIEQNRFTKSSIHYVCKHIEGTAMPAGKKKASKNRGRYSESSV